MIHRLINSVAANAAAVLTCLVAALWLTHLLLLEWTKVTPFAAHGVYLIRLGTIGIALVALLRGLYLHVKKTAPSARSKNLALSACTLAAVVLVLEAAFMFVPKSHGFGYALGHKIWFRYYWRPFNALGYRDVEHDVGQGAKTRKVFVLGDSFTAGHGIKRARDRFSNVLGQRLPSEYTVFNLGRNGSDTSDAYQRLVAFPMEPDLLILQYFGNDIDTVALECGLSSQGFTAYAGFGTWTKFIARNSFLINFIYWQFPHATMQPYADFLSTAYNSPAIFERHTADLARFEQYSRQRDIPLIIVIFPFLSDTSASEVFTKPISEFFNEKGVPVIDVSSLVDEVPILDRIVNPNDQHPSPLVHRLVADALYALLVREGIVDE